MGYEPDGYVSDAAGRSILSLILIFSVLALVAIAIGAAFNSDFRKMIGS
jgi:hypothetical protein